MQAHVVSLVGSGALQRFPGLNVVLEEGGFTWMASLIQRMDRAWRLLGDQVPAVGVAPSELIRKHIWFTTQPMDEIDDDQRFLEMLNAMGMNDHLMFATDYPHWDFDSPDRAIPRSVAGPLREAIYSGNAKSLFKLRPPRQDA